VWWSAYGDVPYGTEARRTGPPGNASVRLHKTGCLALASSIPGPKHALPPITQGGSLVRKLRPPGFVRVAFSNECPYRDGTPAGLEISNQNTDKPWTR